MTDIMRERGSVIRSASQMLMSGVVNLDTMPGLILRIINEDMWRQRAIPQLNWELSREFSSFEEFVTSPPWDGMNTSIQALRDLCHRDDRVVEAIDRACQHQNGGDRRSVAFSVYNINTEPRPTGTSKSAILRRLRKDRPDLLEEVIHGNMSPNAARKEAGFTKSNGHTVNLADPHSAAATIRKYMDPELIGKLVELLRRESE